MNPTAKIISWVLNPIIMPTLALVLIMETVSTNPFCVQENCMFVIGPQMKVTIYSIFFAATFLIPLFLFLVLLSGGVIKTIEMETKRERDFPIIIMLVMSATLLLFCHLKLLGNLWPNYVYSIPLAGTIVCALFFGLNKWKKISIHAAGAGIFTGIILAYSLRHGLYPVWPLALAVFLSGMIMTVRLYLEKHSLLEVGIGWGVALFITFGVVYVYP